MDKLLNHLFDYQLFEPNDRMTRLIDGVEDKYHILAGERMLSDEELSYVSAAGTADPQRKQNPYVPDEKSTT